MNEIKEYTEKLFEDIEHIDENGKEYWLARELMTLLGYSKWEWFSNAIEYAKISFIKSGVKDLARFHNAGYKGLYNGETADNFLNVRN